MTDDDKWRRRFNLFMGARLFGLATFLLGVAILFTDLVRPGGWPVVGSIVVVLGLVDAVVAPMLLKKRWQAEDRDSE
jgi:membrane-bound ClpP family serine protease